MRNLPLSRRAWLAWAGALASGALSACRSSRFAHGSPHLRERAPSPRTHFWREHDRELLTLLGPLSGSSLLDAGAGTGDHAVLMAERGARRVVALDLDPTRVAALTQRFAAVAGERVLEAHEGDIQELPFEDGTFDVTWASHILHFMPEPISVARELARVTRKDGIVAVRENRALLRILPLDVGSAEPGLEERAVAAFNTWFAADRARRGRVPHGWSGVLRRAGLRDVRARSVLFELEPPFDPLQEEYLRGLLARYGEREISDADRAAFAALAEQGGPRDALARDDLHFVSVSTVYLGRT